MRLSNIFLFIAKAVALDPPLGGINEWNDGRRLQSDGRPGVPAVGARPGRHLKGGPGDEIHYRHAKDRAGILAPP